MTRYTNTWHDIQISTDDKLKSFRDSLYEKPNKNLERLRKPDTNHRKQHAVQQQDYDELYTQTQTVTPISFSKEENQNLITDRQLIFVDGSQIIS